MGYGLHLAKHFGRAGLIKPDAGINHPDCIEHAGHAEPSHFTGKDRLAERRLHKALGGQVVDFAGAMLAQHVDERHFVEQIGGGKGNVVLDVADALEVDGAGAADHADNFVTEFEQVFGQI